VLVKTDPRHPALHFKRVGAFWSARVGLHHRALGARFRRGALVLDRDPRRIRYPGALNDAGGVTRKLASGGHNINSPIRRSLACSNAATALISAPWVRRNTLDQSTGRGTPSGGWFASEDPVTIEDSVFSLGFPGGDGTLTGFSRQGKRSRRSASRPSRAEDSWDRGWREE